MINLWKFQLISHIRQFFHSLFKKPKHFIWHQETTNHKKNVNTYRCVYDRTTVGLNELWIQTKVRKILTAFFGFNWELKYNSPLLSLFPHEVVLVYRECKCEYILPMSSILHECLQCIELFPMMVQSSYRKIIFVHLYIQKIRCTADI